MAEKAKAAVPELEKAEIPWAVAYLRDDVQDVRGEIREVRRSIQRLNTKVGELRKGMDGRFEGLRKDADLLWLVVKGSELACTGISCHN